MFPKHNCYCEVFGGSAAVLFKKEQSKVEIYNDLNSWLVNLYRVIRNQPDELINSLEFMPYSREEHNHGLKEYNKLQADTDTLSDVEKAALFFLVIRSSFNAAPGSFTYSVVMSKAGAFRNSIDLIMPAHKRFKEVLIECLPYYEVFTRYDSADTLFYLDPPYPKGTRVSPEVYTYEMSDNDHIEFCEKCLSLEGMCIISSYHNAIYDNILLDAGFYYKDIDVQSSATVINSTSFTNEKPRRTEVLYWNEATESRKSQLALF
jgi:DNA adenine methylase